MKTTTLDQKWSKAIRILFGRRCALSGSAGMIEAHHYIKRKNKLLRWDYRNGVLLSNSPHSPVLCPTTQNKLPAHAYAHTSSGEREIEAILENKGYLTDILYLKNKDYKQYLLENGLTEQEFMLEKGKELDAIIEGGSHE